MASGKHLFILSSTAANIYAIVRRLADNYLLDDADGVFKTGTPADPYLALTENSVEKGLYEVTESRTAWSDGRYRITFYKRAGGAEAPATDAPPLAAQEIAISGDLVVYEKTWNDTLIYLRTTNLALTRQVTGIISTLADVESQLTIWNAFLVSLDKAQRRPGT